MQIKHVFIKAVFSAVLPPRSFARRDKGEIKKEGFKSQTMNNLKRRLIVEAYTMELICNKTYFAIPETREMKKKSDKFNG